MLHHFLQDDSARQKTCKVGSVLARSGRGLVAAGPPMATGTTTAPRLTGACAAAAGSVRGALDAVGGVVCVAH